MKAGWYLGSRYVIYIRVKSDTVNFLFIIYLYETDGRFGQLGKNMAQPVKSLWPELHGLAKRKKKNKPNQ